MAGELPMAPDEYRRLIALHGLTQGQAAAVLGVHTRAAQRFATGDAPIPTLVARVLRIAVKCPSLIDALLAMTPE